MKKCNHKWVDMEDGTNDKLCVRCRKFAMQGRLQFESPKIKLEPPSLSFLDRNPDISDKISNKIFEVSSVLSKSIKKTMEVVGNERQNR